MKILIVIPSFHNGGTNTSLRNLVSKIDGSKYDLSVFAITDYGPNKDFLKEYCTVLNVSEENVSVKTKNLTKVLAKIVRRIKKVLCSIGIDISPLVFRRVAKILERNNYDLVISFQEGGATQLVSCFQNTRKIAWIRCDIQRYLTSEKIIERNRLLYSKFDRIICVSKFTCQQFLKTIPSLSNKTCSLYNLINDELIITRAGENCSLPFSGSHFRIVSVGRFDFVKRFELIPQIASFIKAQGCRFKWLIIGDGKPELVKQTKDGIAKYGLYDDVILFGDCKNPYPYIAQSDVLVCLSSTEACPNVINEAKILHTPVVSADFGSSSEFVDNGYNGVISPIENIGEVIVTLIKNKDYYNTIYNNVSQFKYNNNGIIRVLQEDILV